MSTGQRIKYFRKRKGLSQHELGTKMGFAENTADARIAQYEKDRRFPREDALMRIARVLEVSPEAIRVPDIDTYIGVMHTLFALEDMYGLTVTFMAGKTCLIMDPNHPNFDRKLFDRMVSWSAMKERLVDGYIMREEYDDWRYSYPESQAKMDKVEIDVLRARLKALEEMIENGDDDI